MTEEEKELFIRQLHMSFGYYELQDLTPEENNIHSRFYMAYATKEDVDREMEKIRSEISELEGIADFEEYYKTLVREHINLDDGDNFFESADAGFEDLGELYQKIEKNQKGLTEEEEKRRRFATLKNGEEEKLQPLTSKAEEKRNAYQEKTKDILAEKEENIREAAEQEKKRTEGVLKMEKQISAEINRLKSQNPDAAKIDELNEKLAELKAQKEPYEREINGKNTGDPEYGNILYSISNIQEELSSVNEKNANNVSSLQRLEQMLKSYQEEEKRAHQEYLESVENAEAQCNEKLSKFETEKKDAEVAQNELKDCQDKIDSYEHQRKESEDSLKALNQEKAELNSRVPSVSKACAERILRDKKESLPQLEKYKKVLIKLDFEGYKENPEPEKVLTGLRVVKEAYDSYRHSHHWIARLFKNWPNTSVGQDYARFSRIRSEYTRISTVPRNEIDDYLDHGRYTGILGEKKTSFDNAAAERNQMNNDVHARIPYEVDNRELNDEPAPDVAANLGEEEAQVDVDPNPVQNEKQ